MRKNRLLKTCILCLALTAVIGSGTACFLNNTQEQTIEYRAEAQAGDSVWSICKRISTERDNLPELVWNTTRENHITNPTELQPGQVVIVHVKEINQEGKV